MAPDDRIILTELQPTFRQLGETPNEKAQSQLTRLLSELIKWNASFNLTSITDPIQATRLHLADSLLVLPWIKGPKILDVGTGPGFPGLPLAIMRPELSFVLLDSNSKKVRFIRQVAHLLGIKNVTAVHQRIEQHQMRYPQIISRAFASLSDFVSWSEHCLEDQGQWLAMKGRPTEEEIDAGATVAELVSLHPLQLPGEDTERCLLICQRSKPVHA